MTAVTKGRVSKEIGRLNRLDIAGLKVQWRIVFGRPAPTRIGAAVARRILLQRFQENLMGGLEPALEKALMRHARDFVTQRDDPQAREVHLLPGTRLVREWKGVVEVVEVNVKGFTWRNRHFATLTAVARAITGGGWSGPRFFGFKDRKRLRLGPDNLIDREAA